MVKLWLSKGWEMNIIGRLFSPSLRKHEYILVAILLRQVGWSYSLSIYQSRNGDQIHWRTLYP
jgi:hypothetical protein